MHHAWNSLNDKVIDLTWGPLVKAKGNSLRRTSRILGEFSNGYSYFGITIPTPIIIKELVTTRVFGSIIYSFLRKLYQNNRNDIDYNILFNQIHEDES